MNGETIGSAENGNGGGSDGLARVRRSAGGLLDAADEAIDRVLSGDSESFLRQNRQQGGQ